MAYTTEDYTCVPFANVGQRREITIPAGTEVVAVSESSGFAVKHAALIVRLTGNTHDPHYRYVWVPARIVE